MNYAPASLLRRLSALAALVCLLLGLVSRPAAAQTPVVHALLFFSPTCGHCEMVINEVLPPLAAQYGEQLQIELVNVMLEPGAKVYQNAVEELNIPQNRLGVPTLVLGATVLVGSQEIPEQLPGLIENRLASGGVELPQISGLAELLAAPVADPVTMVTTEAAAAAPSAATAVAPAAPAAAAPTATGAGWQEKFSRDPLGNSIAVALLVVMVLSVIAVTAGYVTDAAFVQRPWPTWLIPVLSVIGLGVALYLSYVEVLGAAAVCGPVGDCNSVQTSEYARLFGILPIGVLGAVGYVGIFAAYGVQQRGPAAYRRLATLALWGMAWFGLLFSIYLTFLEPFVIGATCIWCIISAVVMTLIFWASTPAALHVLQPAEDDEPLAA